MTDLRCHSCSHVVGVSTASMRIVGLFKASLMGKVDRSHVHEVRHRCRSCGWVNIFHPVTAPKRVDAIEVKA